MLALRAKCQIPQELGSRQFFHSEQLGQEHDGEPTFEDQDALFLIDLIISDHVENPVYDFFVSPSLSCVHR